MMDKKLKIAVYSGEIPSTTFIENLIEVLSEGGFEIYLFGKLTKIVSYNKNIKLFPTPVKKFSLILFTLNESLKLFFKNPATAIKCWKNILCREKGFYMIFKKAGFILPVLNNPPDIFHIQWAKTVDKHPELFELLNCRIALSLRGAHINYSPLTDKNLAQSYRKYFPHIDGFHAVSKAIASESMKYGAPQNKIKVIHSSIKSDFLNNRVQIKEDKKLIEIISIGRHHWKKGYHYALDAMKILKDSNVSFKYTIIAQGEMPEELILLLEEYQFGSSVQIVKGMPHNELMEFLKKMDILLLPSVEEGIANVVLEAMAVGVPVITTDCGGMNEIINDSINGYIIPVRDPVLIADKIRNFAETDKKVKEEIVIKAKKTIEEEFSREKQAEEFHEFYYSLVS